MTKDRFDSEAELWEKNPTVTESSKLALEAIKTRARFSKDKDVLEIGCGTGYLSALVAPHVNRLLGVDTSNGMIDVFKRKQDSHPNMHGLVLLLEEQSQISKHTEGRFDKFDLVISHLVFHHIPDMLPTIKVAFDCLKTGGTLIITDFENTPTSRAFHPENKMEGVERHGLKQEEMRSLLKQAGFEDVKVEEAFVLKKETENDGKQDFPFLACMGRRA